MNGNAAGKSERYTWSDYRQWPDELRCEIVGGEVYDMTPAPIPRHQRILMELSVQFTLHFRGKTCMPFIAPTDIKLSDEDIVQPDLFVVCEPDKIRKTHIEGAPTLVVEILSPSTALHDRVRKMALYARCGVKEVWIVTPFPWMIEVYVLDGATYRLMQSRSNEGQLRSPTLPDLVIDLPPVFDFPLEPGETFLRESHRELPRAPREGNT